MTPVDEETRQFEKLMEQIGVVPIDDRRDVRTRRAARQQREAELDRSEEAEFEAAMAALDLAPNKDRQPVDEPAKKVSRIRFRPREQVVIQASLDLHGLTQEEAVVRLERFVPDCFADGKRILAIITGKGLHSHNGVPVIKPLVEGWLRTDGDRFVAEYGDAPARHGGSGVLLVRLRPRLKGT